MRLIARPPGYAAALLLAGTAALAAPAAAQAAAGPPGFALVPCSGTALATAIQNANTAGTAILRLAPRCDYALTTAAAPGDGLSITGNLTIAGGPGTSISRSTTSGLFRILHVASGAKLTLTSVTVTNGRSLSTSPFGGGIRDEGTLVLRNVRLTGNTSTFGGGLFVDPSGHATVSNSRVDDNNAVGGEGGGILNQGSLVVAGSTLAGNASRQGGGVFTEAGATTRISQTAVTHNLATNLGGGFFNLGTTVLTGDRVVANQATSGGGGIFNFNNHTVTLRLTLVALNTPDNCNPRGTIAGCLN